LADIEHGKGETPVGAFPIKAEKINIDNHENCNEDYQAIFTPILKHATILA